MNTVTLSAVEFDVVWRDAGLGAPPTVLGLASPGRTHTARRTSRRRSGRRCASAGRGGAPGPIPTSNVSFACSRSRQSRWRFTRGALPPSAPHWPEGPTAPCSHSAPATRCYSRRVPRSPRAAVASSALRDRDRAGRPLSPLQTWRVLRRPTGAGLRTDLVDRGVDPAEAGLIAACWTVSTGVRSSSVLRPGPPGHPAPRGRAARGSRRPARPLPDYPVPRRRRHRLDLRRTDRRPPPAPPVERMDRRRPSDQSRSPWRISWRPASVIDPDSEG